MVFKQLFQSAGKAKSATARNEAGGKAFAFSPEHALAQYAVTGTLHNTFYASASDQLEKLIELADACSPDFVARVALYARERGFMKDVPAFLVAYLAKRDVALMKAIFSRVIDSGKMLRNFVQVVRSGLIGRKSLGTAPKRAAQAWFRARSPEIVFRNSLGAAPSMADVIKLVRPVPKNPAGEKDLVREALYGYLIGKTVEKQHLPPVVRAFEAFKAGEGPMPDVPFEMLTALELTKEHWTAIAKAMSWTQTRMNLNTLLRKGVFEDASMVELIAERLRGAAAIRRARAFPYQLLAAFRAASGEMPKAITNALQDALEIATENVPALPGKVFVCPDVSGSMQSAVTGHRGSATSAVRCVDIAGLVAASLMRRSEGVEVIPFSDDVVKMPRPLNARDSVMTNAQYLASLPSGGTACSAPLRRLNQKKAKGDLVIYVSDNQSWVDFGMTSNGRGTRGTAMAEEWETFQARNSNAKLVLIDIQPYATTQVGDRSDVLNVGGFSDAVFELVSLFAKSELEGAHFVRAIKNVTL
jgi:60 kDa SS-A/Ro ribonucleoprotein